MDSDAEGVPSEFFDYFKVVTEFLAPLLLLGSEADKILVMLFRPNAYA